ncbi:MAG: peptidyl-prolyl cis-trans isomerase [Elusimicrobia bacterium]|nr:peptidyl-prolyl cis-trans isomerase [Elusimicrobiota bacterium]
MNAIFALCLTALLTPASAQADKDIIKVNGTTIRQSEVMQRLWDRFGAETLDEMVDELLLRQAVAAKKISPEAAQIDRRLAKMRAQFSDEKVFESQLAEAGSSLDKLKKDITEGISRELLVVGERKLKVDDEELKSAFDSHKDELGTQEGVHLRHILVKTDAEAQEISKKIKVGADFKKLAAEKSLAPTGKINGGDYGFVTKGMLPPEIEQIAFALKPQEVRLVSSEKGVHILQALDRRPAAPAKFEAVKEDLRELLLQQKVKQALPEFVIELRKKADIQPQGR